jgi:hypothetical protein
MSQQFPDAIGQSLSDFLGTRPNVKQWGAVGDAIQLTDGVVSSGSVVVTSATATFKASDVGKTIVVKGAGASGKILKTTITKFTDAHTIEIGSASGISANGVTATYGTDDTNAFKKAYASIHDHGGGTLFVPGGLYLLTDTLILDGPFSMEGCGMKIDKVTDYAAGNKSFTALLSTSNPIIWARPYPTISIDKMLLCGLGTTGTLDLFEVANYQSQIGVWAGCPVYPLPTLPADTYGYAGSGSLYMDRVSFSGDLGWGIYAPKLWGQSTLSNLFFYYVGTVPEGGDKTHYGAMNFQGECADVVINGVHAIGHNAGAVIKFGCTTAEAATMNRFYTVCTHFKVNNVFTEGTGHYPLLIRSLVRSSFENCHFGGTYQEFEFGEKNFVHPFNCEFTMSDCGAYNVPEMNIFAWRVMLDNWVSEGWTTTNVNYWYSGITVRGRNLILQPSGDKTKSYGGNIDKVANLPVAITDEPRDSTDLVPDFDSPSWSYSTGEPKVWRMSANEIRLYEATATCNITGLIPGEVYTFAFRHKTELSYGYDLSYRLYETGGSDILANKLGLYEDISNKEQFILAQFIAPASGNLSIEFATTSTNQTYWSKPFIGKGPHTEVTAGEYFIAVEATTGDIVGHSVKGKQSTEVSGNFISRSFTGLKTMLTSVIDSTFKRLGLGFNIGFNGDKWVIDTDGTDTGAALITGDPHSGNVDFYGIPSDNTLRVRRLSSSDLTQYKRFTVAENHNHAFWGVAGVDHNLHFSKIGNLSSSNVDFMFAHSGTGLRLYANDGTDYWYNVWNADYATKTLLLNDKTKIQSDGSIVLMNGSTLTSSSGSPEGNQDRPKGSIHLDMSSGTIWFKSTASGFNTGWKSLGPIFEISQGADSGYGTPAVKLIAHNNYGNTPKDALVLERDVSGDVGANGNGVSVLARVEDSTGTVVDSARMAFDLQNATTNQGRFILQLRDGNQMYSAFAVEKDGKTYIRTGQSLFGGNNSPEGVVSSAVGSLYMDAVNGALYVKNTGTGNTGWKRLFDGAINVNQGSESGYGTAPFQIAFQNNSGIGWKDAIKITRSVNGDVSGLTGNGVSILANVENHAGVQIDAARFIMDLSDANELPLPNGSAKGRMVFQLHNAGSMENALLLDYDGKITLKTGLTIRCGTGSPEGVYSDPAGSLFVSSSGLFMKTGTGNTGWQSLSVDIVAKTLTLKDDNCDLTMKKSGGTVVFHVTKDGQLFTNDTVLTGTGTATNVFNVKSSGGTDILKAGNDGSTTAVKLVVTTDVWLQSKSAGVMKVDSNAKVVTGSVDLASGEVAGLLPISKGGTGAATASGARTAIGAAAASGLGAGSATLAKLTPGGTNGSIGWNDDGVITSITQPT